MVIAGVARTLSCRPVIAVGRELSRRLARADMTLLCRGGGLFLQWRADGGRSWKRWVFAGEDTTHGRRAVCLNPTQLSLSHMVGRQQAALCHPLLETLYVGLVDFPLNHHLPYLVRGTHQ